MFKTFQFRCLTLSYLKSTKKHLNTKFMSYLYYHKNYNNNHIHQNKMSDHKNREMLVNIEKGFENVCREWEDTEMGRKFRTDYRRFPGSPFIVMSYNVLAQVYIQYHQDLYRFIHPNFLRWEHRLDKILKELYKIRPHILCLQEVEDVHYAAIKQGLKDLDYKGLFFKRTGDKSDGCAIFFNKRIFHIGKHLNLKLYSSEERLLGRDNIAIFIKLSPKLNPSKSFVVANTHLLYNPKRDDIRLAQLQTILTALKDFAQSECTSVSYPVILVGDFNFPPTSNLFEFVTQGGILWDKCLTKVCQQELRTARNNTEESKPTGSHNAEQFKKTVSSDKMQRITHSMNLESVLSRDQLKYRATTYHREWLTVDHIFYTKEMESSLKLLSTFLPPDKRDCFPIPNGVFGSDHHCVAANFLLT